MEQRYGPARSRDKVGRAYLLGLLAWARYGPERPVTAAERLALTAAIVPGLTEAESRSGTAWAAGITGRPELAGGGPAELTPDFAERIIAVLVEAGDPIDIPPPMLTAMIGMVNPEDAGQVGMRVRREAMLAVAALAFARAAESSDPALALVAAGNLCDALNSAGRSGEAIEAADTAIGRHPEPGREADAGLALLLYNRAVALRTRQEADGAAIGAEFEAVAARFTRSADRNAREFAARARLNATAAYLTASDASEALSIADEFLNLADVYGLHPLSDAIASVMVNRAQALSLLGRPADAAAASEAISERFSGIATAWDNEIEKALARAAIISGRALAALGERDAAIAAFGRAERSADEPGELGQIARQATAEARALRIEGLETDLARYDEYLARPSETRADGTTDPLNRLRRAMVRVNRGVTLAALDRPVEAIETYQDLIGEIRDDTEPAMRVQLAMAMVNCGNSYRATGQAGAALAIYREVEEEFGESADPAALIRAAQAALNQGVVYEESGNPDAAAERFTAAADRYGGAAAPEVRDVALSARWNVIVIRLRTGDLAAVLATVNQITNGFGADANAAIRRRVAESLISASVEISQRGGLKAALGVLASLSRFADDPDPEVSETVALGEWVRAELGGAR